MTNTLPAKKVAMTRSNARRDSAQLFEEHLPKPNERLIRLRGSDLEKFVTQFISFLYKHVGACHPKSDIGWWCCYPDDMKHVLTYLSEDPKSLHDNVWHQFRDNVSDQISRCRQCATAYHTAVSEWEVDDVSQAWSAATRRKRVIALLEWDVDRLTPMIEKGLISVSNEKFRTTPDRMHCREALFEALVSIRVCMHSGFCESLGNVFQKRTPVNGKNEVIPFIISLRKVPTGLLALCFHESSAVRSWAQTLYRSASPKFPVCRKSQWFLIMKAIRCLDDRSGNMSPTTRTNNVWGSCEESVRDGLRTLLQSMKLEALTKLFDRVKKPPVLRVLSAGLLTGDRVIFSASYNSISHLIGLVSFDYLFWDPEMTPEQFVDVISRSLVSPSRTSDDRRRLLLLLKLLMNGGEKGLKKSVVPKLLHKCIDVLQEARSRLGEKMPTTLRTLAVKGNTERNITVELLQTGVEIIKSAYLFMVPKLPFSFPHRVITFLLSALHEDTDGSWAWRLVRFMLFTDVFNLLRCMYERQDVMMISQAYLGFKPNVDDIEKVIDIPLEEERVLTWMGPLWTALEKGTYRSDGFKVSRDAGISEARIMLDLHRLIGTLNSNYCGSSISDERLEKIAWIPSQAAAKRDARAAFAKCIETVQRTTLACLERALEDSQIRDRLVEMPFHAAHLLTGSHQGVSSTTVTLLRRQHCLENIAVAENVSLISILLRVMGDSEKSCRMLADGCISFMQLLSALRNNVSARTYASFLHWYRTLVFSNPKILKGKKTGKWAVGVLLQFIESWQRLEATTKPDIFYDTCRIFFQRLCELWPHFTSSDHKPQTRSGIGKSIEESWLKRTLKGLLSMSQLKDDRNVESWNKLINHDNLRQSIRGDKELQDLFAKSYENLQRLERGRTTAARSNGNSKKYSNSRIDSYFTRNLNPQQGGNAASPAFITRHNMVAGVQHLPVLSGTNLQRMAPKLMLKPSSGRGGLTDLRREHRIEKEQNRTDLHRGKGRRPAIIPGKTRFELMREQNIAERERKHALQQQKTRELQIVNGISPNGSNPTSPDQKRHTDEEDDIYRMTPPQKLQDKFVFPAEKRVAEKRNVEQVHRAILAGKTIGSEIVCPLDATFDSVESYINYWQPLIVEEFRASISSAVHEERSFARLDNDQRTPFEVEGPCEDIGFLQYLSLKSCEEKGDGSKKNKGGEKYHLKYVQVSDVIVLYIPPRNTDAAMIPSKQCDEVIGIVSKVSRNQGKSIVQVKISTSTPPGKGRRLRASKLMSLSVFQRQLDALWSLPNAPDGILWSLLQPSDGRRLQEQLLDINESQIEEDCARPMNIIGVMERKGSLNESQRQAISEVIKNCGPVFAKCNDGTFDYTKPDHSGISLIQGPPGTGKTATTISLLSAIFADKKARALSRKAKIVMDGEEQVVSVPAIRVLVCAPSNAAVDEIMIRVMNEGLKAKTGKKAFVPRILRVGQGTTQESIRQVELRTLSKQDAEAEGRETYIAKPENLVLSRRKQLDQIHENIGKLDKKRREVGEASAKALSPEQLLKNQAQYRKLTESLTMLHEEKKRVHGLVNIARDQEKENTAVRRREGLRIMAKTLNGASIVFSTLSSAGSEIMKTLAARFDMVIIDEAAQSCEPDILIPMTLGCSGSATPRFVHTVLVGDPMQLPATVLSENQAVAKALGTSLFERLGKKSPDAVHMLDVQYRMHPMISEFPSRRFYRGLLKDGANVLAEKMGCSFHVDSKKRFGPLTFIDTWKTNAREIRNAGGSVSNREEANWIVSSIVALLRSFGRDELQGQIVVLSPYKGQVNLLKNMIAENRLLTSAGIEVSTVDGIQGREKSVVMLSTVRSGHSKNIGFVKDYRRLNVAITRAKHSLIVFGNSQFLGTHSEDWKALVDHCTEKNAVLYASGSPHNFYHDCRIRRVLPSKQLEKRELESGRREEKKERTNACEGVPIYERSSGPPALDHMSVEKLHAMPDSGSLSKERPRHKSEIGQVKTFQRSTHAQPENGRRKQGSSFYGGKSRSSRRVKAEASEVIELMKSTDGDNHLPPMTRSPVQPNLNLEDHVPQTATKATIGTEDSNPTPQSRVNNTGMLLKPETFLKKANFEKLRSIGRLKLPVGNSGSGLNHALSNTDSVSSPAKPHQGSILTNGLESNQGNQERRLNNDSAIRHKSQFQESKPSLRPGNENANAIPVIGANILPRKRQYAPLDLKNETQRHPTPVCSEPSKKKRRDSPQLQPMGGRSPAIPPRPLTQKPVEASRQKGNQHLFSEGKPYNPISAARGSQNLHADRKVQNPSAASRRSRHHATDRSIQKPAVHSRRRRNHPANRVTQQSPATTRRVQDRLGQRSTRRGPINVSRNEDARSRLLRHHQQTKQTNHRQQPSSTNLRTVPENSSAAPTLARQHQSNWPRSNRPQTSRPQSNRPQSNRPQINRSQSNRPQSNRPPSNRPQSNRQSNRPQFSLANLQQDIEKTVENAKRASRR